MLKKDFFPKVEKILKKWKKTIDFNYVVSLGEAKIDTILILFLMNHLKKNCSNAYT